MNQKTYTFLVTTNRRGETRSYTVSSAWVKAGALLSGIFLILASSVSVDYLGLLLKEGENKRLKANNARLDRQLKIVENKVSTLEDHLERVKNFETKLKMITNIDDEDHSLNLAIGPMPKAGQAFFNYNQANEERGPASEFLQKDSLFLQNPPLDISRGEIGLQDKRNYAMLSVRIDGAVREAQLRETSVLSLHETLSERRSLLNATPSIKPTRGWPTSRFGYRVDPFTGKPIMHKGLDLAAPPGTPVRAPADGKVVYVGYEPGYGKIVSVDHGYGVKTRYAHNSQIFVEVGAKVRRRDVIAAVGSTGRSSGPHLHYEVRIHDVPVDPINYLLDDYN